jgi:hypothetical protein
MDPSDIYLTEVLLYNVDLVQLSIDTLDKAFRAETGGKT